MSRRMAVTGSSSTTAVRVGTASMAVFMGEMGALFWQMRWLLVLAAVLVFADFWLGVHRSIKGAVTIRWSKAIRRTLMKIADYLCVVILGAVVGKAIGEPLGYSALTIAVVMMGIACLCEFDSIISNWGEIKGVEINVFKLAFALFGYKRKEMADALKECIKKKKSESNDN